MIYSKKGVSTIVANVLIVLLVIVGVAVIWAVVNPTLEKSAEGISASDCFSVSVSPVSCDPAGTVVVERGAGAAAPLYGLRLLVTDTNGDTTTTLVDPTQAVGLDTVPGELESKSYSVSSATDDTFNVAAVIGTAASNQVCAPLSQPVRCVTP